jgi:hypothetical protein
MSANRPPLVSGRVPVTDYGNLTADRYEFLGLNQAEPNLGTGAANAVLTLGNSNTRIWSNSLTLQQVSVTGNVIGGGFLTTGNISASGTITAGNFIGNISGNIDAAGNVTEVQFNAAGNILGASAGFTFDSASNLLTVAGNVNSANMVTGNVSATGNIFGNNNASFAGNVTSNLSFVTNGITLFSNQITANVTFPANYNGLSVGPLTVADGVLVSIGTNNWIVL